MLNDFSLAGKVAIVTGAGRGLGKGICTALAEAGADVVAIARSKAQIEETCSEVRQRGRRGVAIPLDVTNGEQIEAMVKRTLSEFGTIDILVNNAGAFVMKTVIPMPGLKNRFTELVPNLNSVTTIEDWRIQMDTNVTGAFILCQAVGAHMIEKKNGKIINVTTIDTIKAYPYHAAYAASKAALANLTKHLALEWGRYGINVNAVAPGFFRTNLTEWAHNDKQTRDAMLYSVPLRRFGDPKDIGAAVVFLASRASDYITGWTIPVDGGVHL